MLPFFQRILVLIVGLSAAHTSLCCCTICEQGSHARKPVFWDLKNKNQTQENNDKIGNGSNLDGCRLSICMNFTPLPDSTLFPIVTSTIINHPCLILLRPAHWAALPAWELLKRLQAHLKFVAQRDYITNSEWFS